MSNALLIHGWTTEGEYYNTERPTPNNDHWFPWLSKQLVVRDIPAVAIEMPHSFYPEYEIWKRELERYDINEDTILVGHSCGGGFLVRWLSETGQQVGKVVLVAPWLGVDLSRGSESFDKSFFSFAIDPGIIKRTSSLVIFNSLDDSLAIQESVAKIRQEVGGVNYREFATKGHFTKKSLGGEAFPELLEEIVS